MIFQLEENLPRNGLLFFFSNGKKASTFLRSRRSGQPPHSPRICSRQARTSAEVSR
jgi:hypothetical protein